MRTFCILLIASAGLAQEPPAWQAAAGGKMAFEVVSIKRGAREKFSPPAFPLDAGDAYAPTGGRFFAAFPLTAYIQFAYKEQLTRDQIDAMVAHLPKWVASDIFEIEAKASVPDPTKDQMRLMMQSLLADRFKLVVHFETQTVPVFAMVLAKPGKTGPALRPHSEGPPCDKSWQPGVVAPPQPGEVFPPVCEVYMVLKRPSARVGARNTTMDLLANAIAGFSGLGRPVVNQTGLGGRYDLVLEWMPELSGPVPPGSEPDSQAPPFLEALRDQLGLKLESTKAPIQSLIVDHVEQPSDN